MLVLDMFHTVVSCPYARPCAYPGECPASVQFQAFIGDNGTRNAMKSQIYDGIGRKFGVYHSSIQACYEVYNGMVGLKRREHLKESETSF
jgi:hypothetical protein